MKKSNFLLGTLLGLGLVNVTAQEVSVDALIRPRFEYRHGFQDVVPDVAEGSAFVSQRSSLLLNYKDSKIKTILDLQSTSVWGDRPQLSTTDDQGNGSFRVNRAWAEIDLGKGFSTKVGRQFLSYDDQRILGALGWADQQRTHDAALIKYKKATFKADVGFAFNQNGIGNFDNLFTASGAGQPIFQYKSLQFLHLHNKFNDKFSGSALLLNNGFQDTDATTGEAVSGSAQRQTYGINGKYKNGKVGFDFSGYYQSGEFTSTRNISAYNAAVNATYKLGSTLLGLGAEALSGDDPDSAQTEAFFPLFGTNHKFNGYQDFFFVGRHANNGGLLDLNAKAVFKLASKSKLITKAHYFSGLEEAGQGDEYYGTEIDLVFVHKINAYANIKVGYSQTFFNDDFADARANFGRDLTTLPAVDADDIQNWGWVMLTIKPNLFKWKKEADTIVTALQ